MGQAIAGRALRDRDAPLRIYVKCHSRPFLLDRCLRSIRDLVTGHGGVVVLNDGIGEPYLSALVREHPDVRFRNSWKLAAGIVSAPWSGHPVLEALVDHAGVPAADLSPAPFWVEAVMQDPADHVLIMEEDGWFTEPLDLGELPPLGDVASLSLRGEGHPAIPAGQRFGLWQQAIREMPDFGMIFPIAFAVFQTDYWCHAYRYAPHWATEAGVFRGAAQFLDRHLGPLRVGTSARACIRQGTRTTGRLDSGGVGFLTKIRVQDFNEALNRRWLDGQADPMVGFPNDRDDDWLAGIYEADLGSDAAAAWRAWRREYAAYYG